MSQTQSPISSTTPEALRAAIAEAVQVDVQQLQAAVGSIQVATSEQLQIADPQIKSLYDADSRTLTLLADRISAGQEAEDFAAALIHHLGQQTAGVLLGDEGVAKARKQMADNEQRAEPHNEAEILKNVLGQAAAKPFYIWANDDCDNKTSDFKEAKAIRLSLFNEGGESVHIVDADGVEVVDAEIECHEALAKSGYFAGERNPGVRPGFSGAFMVYDPQDSEGFAIVGDDVGALILEAHAQVIELAVDRKLTNGSDLRQPIAGAEGAVMAKLRDVSGGLDVIERAFAVVSTGDLSQAPFPLVGDNARIYLNSQTSAYLHVLEMCSAQTLKEWLMSDQASMTSEEEVLAKLQEVAQGFEVIEAALKKCSEGDLAQAPFPLVGENARIHLSAQSAAYLHALEMCNASTLHEFLKETQNLSIHVVRAGHAAELANGAEKLAAIGGTEPAVYLLAEFSWGDDAFGERLPVAGLYRVTESTLRRMDNIVDLIESNDLSPNGASVSVPSRDVALLSCVAFTDDNTLASVPEFFDSEKDRIVYLCDVANIDIDLERADYRDACELYAQTSAEDQEGNFAGIHLSSSAEVGGVAISADGQAGVWRLHGFMDSWAKVRNQIEAHLDQQKAVGRNVDVPAIDETLAGRKLNNEGPSP